MSRGDTPARRRELLGALRRALRMTSAQSVLLSQAAADRLGLNSTDMECLDLLNLSGPVPAGRLAELTGLTTGAITGVIDRLEQASYVRREPDPTDRRRVIVRPIVERQVEAEEAFAPLAQATDALLERFTDDELAVLLRFLTEANSMVLEQITRLRREARAPERRRPASNAPAREAAAQP